MARNLRGRTREAIVVDYKHQFNQHLTQHIQIDVNQRTTELFARDMVVSDAVPQPVATDAAEHDPSRFRRAVPNLRSA